MNSLTIELPQYRYHLKTWGHQSSPPLILLHGFMGSLDDFETVVETLCTQYYCIALDLPGHGKTDVLGDTSCYQMEAIAPSLIQVLDRLSLPPAHLLGYSMGGRIALYLAIYYPDYFRTVTLESASPGLATEQQRRDRRQRDHAIAQRLEQDNFTEFLDWWYSATLFQSLRQHPAYLAMLQRRQQNRPTELARSLRQLSTGRQPSLWGQLSRLTRPCLWLVGQNDRKFVQIASQVNEQQPSIHRQILASCGHNIHIEAPDRWCHQVSQFIAKKTPY